MKKLLCTLLMALLLVPVVSRAQTPVSYFGAIPDLKVSGNEFVDPTGKAVTLHGVMDTPNDHFNGNRWSKNQNLGWPVYNNPNAVSLCKQYFTKIFQAIANPAKGTYCNLFRLHLDPAWTNDPNKSATNGGGENDISRFSADRLRTYMADLYVPIIKDALAHGLYVIVRPPGVFPEDVTVGDAYNEYLMTVWDIVSNDSYIKSHAGQIMLELGNEPVRMSGNLADYFQPIVNKIRQNGFTGILLLPGTSYQADYRNYNTKPISDDNFGYAVHNYPGWYGGWDANQTEASFISTFETQVPVDKKPIVITEVDWSPMKEGAGHYNEYNQYVEGNFGTWATGTTNSPAPNVAYKNTQNVGWGMRFKHLVDKHPNISWTLQGTTTYVDMDAYLKDGTVKPAFTDEMKAAGYADAGEACSKMCMEWYYEYACGNRIPYGTPSVAPEVVTYYTTATITGNAKFDETNAHYCFYTSTYSSFTFKEYAGTPLTKCAEFTINLGEGSTIGYRLDVQLKDANGNIIKDGINDYIIGTEAKGTRFTSAESKTFDFQTIFAEYIEQYPGCTVGEIRLNTVVSSEDTNREGKYWFTISKMDMNVSELVARQGNKGTSLADVKMYKHESTKNVVVNDDAETAKMGGWGGTITRTAGAGMNGSYGYVLTNEKTNTYEAQVSYDGTYPIGTEYTLTMDIKGASDGSMPINFQKSEGYVGCGSATVNYTTEWQTVAVPIKVTGEGANRLLFDYGGKSTLYIDNVQLYTGSDKLTEITGTNIRLGEDATNGAEVFGAGLLGNVAQNEYADLSAYNKMIIKGTGGSLRVLYNRPTEGNTPEINPTLASGEAVVDLSAYPYFHLNSIKAGWGQTVNISSITLINGSGNNVEIADYYITGAGHITDAAQAALDDVSATVIDATGLTNINPWNLSTANPNCLILYKNDDQVGFTWSETTRNLVKNAGGYSAYRTNLYDNYDFRAPFAFNTVGGATYTRDLGTNTWGITVIPFALDITTAGSPEVYVLAAEQGTTLKFAKQTSGPIAAGSVILYYKENGGEAKLTGKNIAVTADGFNIQPTSAKGWYTAQSYKHQVIDDVTTDPYLKDYEVYAISGNKFVHATKKLTLKPFRALYLCKKGSSAAKASFGISIGDNTTGIEEPLNITETAEAQRYDIMGRKVSAPAKGVNIVRMPNGTVRKVLNY